MYPLIYITSTFSLPSYLLTISLSYAFGLIWIVKRAQQRGFTRNLALDFSMLFMVTGFIGARFTHVLFEAPDYYSEDPRKIFMFWNGGFVFYGGALFAFLSCLIFAKRRRVPFLTWLSIFAPVLSLGYIIGRVGCFMAGCCYGKECNLPWAVVFPAGVEAPAIVSRHPTQVYASLCEFLTLLVLLLLESRGRKASAQQRSQPTQLLINQPGFLFFIWMIGHGIGRTIMEHFRADDRGPLFLELSLGTWISIFIVICGFSGILYLSKSLNVRRET